VLVLVYICKIILNVFQFQFVYSRNLAGSDTVFKLNNYNGGAMIVILSWTYPVI